MEDRNNFRKYGDIRVCFETAEERQRAFEILESRGFSIPERLKDPASFAPRGTPGATNLLDINIRWKKLKNTGPGASFRDGIVKQYHIGTSFSYVPEIVYIICIGLTNVRFGFSCVFRRFGV